MIYFWAFVTWTVLGVLLFLHYCKRETPVWAELTIGILFFIIGVIMIVIIKNFDNNTVVAFLYRLSDFFSYRMAVKGSPWVDYLRH